ncbi:hypothetical protein PMZ80_001906 [Knufia obscura]|uniref:EthD domain-containing protein n=1 Tax=Knufia obscura TaxID=1635080 RepID=A0ABR0RVT3_9EURO|nr:hypothetical protein PMZ80_001906 [Knufia obscura]
MPNKLLILAVRKEGMTPAAFKDYYETVHIPLMKQLSGDKFPVSHHRRYSSRTGAPGENVPYDAVAEIVYRDQEHMQAHSALLGSEENQQKVMEDCMNFLDLSKTANIVVEEDIETLGSTG